MDIEHCIDKARAGDVESYGPVVTEYQGRIRAFVAACCPDASQVDEVAQRTFIWAYEHLDRYESGTRFFLWLKAIARTMLLSELETQRREASNRKRYLAASEEETTLTRLRHFTRTGRAAGDDAALSDLEGQLGLRVRALPRGRPKKNQPAGKGGEIDG
jgi:DNA-directed RNA polymerase specialized sigma24 family protein